VARYRFTRPWRSPGVTLARAPGGTRSGPPRAAYRRQITASAGRTGGHLRRRPQTPPWPVREAPATCTWKAAQPLTTEPWFHSRSVTHMKPDDARHSQVCRGSGLGRAESLWTVRSVPSHNLAVTSACPLPPHVLQPCATHTRTRSTSARAVTGEGRATKWARQPTHTHGPTRK
jgi:hypothetical protein